MIARDNWSVPFRYIVGIVSLVLFIALLIYAREAVTNLAIAAFVAYLINPAVVYLTTRTRMDRVAAVNLVYFSTVVLLIDRAAGCPPADLL
jgi:predicted PurR-regulated permease PerM